MLVLFETPAGYAIFKVRLYFQHVRSVTYKRVCARVDYCPYIVNIRIYCGVNITEYFGDYRNQVVAGNSQDS